jgi:hypothetical protein
MVSAGRRKITATRPGKAPVTQLVDLAGGDSKKVALVVAGDDVAEPVTPSRGVPAAPWIITGVLGVGAIVTGSLALSASSTLKTDLGVYPNANPDQITSDHSKTFALALTTDILIGAAVVGLGVSIYLTATAGPRRVRSGWVTPLRQQCPAGRSQDGIPCRGPFVRLEPGPQGARLSGTF